MTDADDMVEETKNKEQSSYSGRSDVIEFDNSIKIYPNKRLPYLDRSVVKAYAASTRQGKSLFALVCDKSLVPRFSNIFGFASFNNLSMARIISSGIVYWPSAKEEKYVIIFEDNLGKPILSGDINPNSVALGIKYEKVLDSIITPLVSVLVDLRNSDLIHGSISTSNLFDGNSSNIEKVMLGECVSTPASYCQPVLYEPIERALCDPEARGVGTIADDVYSFGVTIATILRSNNPLSGASDREIIKHKIDVGSYLALIGNGKITGPVLELLRGTLHDDVSQRWSVDDIEAWIDGRRLSPKQAIKRNKANRPLLFNGNKYIRPQILAVDLADNISEAAQLIESGGLNRWIVRSLSDSSLDEKIEEAIDLSEKGNNYLEKLVAKVSIALFPSFPISYKKIAFHPYGFGTSLAKAIFDKSDISSYVDVLNQNFVMYWVNMQSDILPDIVHITSKFDAARNYVQQNNLAFGIERVLYHMCPDAPCYSDKFSDYYVRTAEDLLRVYNILGKDKNKRPVKFMDRHVIAFLLVHEKKVIESNLVGLNSADEHRVVLATLRILGEMQRKLRVKKLEGITDWLADYVEPLYERIHDRDERGKIKDKINKLRDSGDIRKMLDILDNDNKRVEDYNNFQNAMVEYKNLVYEREQLRRKLVNKNTYGVGIGREWAAVVSGIISMIVVMALLFIYLVKGESVF